MEDPAQQMDSVIVGWMECINVKIIWKLLHSTWKFLFQIEWWVLQWTLNGSSCTAGGQWYCRLNGVCYSEHNVKVTA